MNVAAAALPNRADYPAFAYCTGLNEDVNNDGEIDADEMVWYLPSMHQLMAMYVFNSGIDVPVHSVNWYCSATEFSSNGFHLVNFGGETNSAFKNDPLYYVRCVRDIMP